MGKTPIEWTRGDDGSPGASCNPIVGCTECSPGCANCYAARLAATRLKSQVAYNGLATITDRISRWNGQVHFLPERLNEPRHWKKPRRIFVCDMGDLFHEAVPDSWIDEVWAMCIACPQHTFQVLTKRAGRMRDYVRNVSADRIRAYLRSGEAFGLSRWPVDNIWLGVSTENQRFADERIRALMETPAAVRWISAEPLLGPLDIMEWLPWQKNAAPPFLDWIVCGGESGHRARPMHPDWARSLRDQCQATGVPFFFKQWGEFAGGNYFTTAGARAGRFIDAGGTIPGVYQFPDGTRVFKTGKKRAGRDLDGRHWNEFPKVPVLRRSAGV